MVEAGIVGNESAKWYRAIELDYEVMEKRYLISIVHQRNGKQINHIRMSKQSLFLYYGIRTVLRKGRGRNYT